MAGDGSKVRELFFARLEADVQTTNNTVLTKIDSLGFDIKQNEIWKVKTVLMWTADIAGGTKVDIDAPAVAGNLRLYGIIISAGAAGVDSFLETTFKSGNLGLLGTSGHAIIEATIENVGVSGVCHSYFAQQASNANPTTILRGSFMEALRVG